ncbi:MAG: S-layer homology domain-containing protein [Candidatus Margulisiibacteriota bacterium]
MKRISFAVWEIIGGVGLMLGMLLAGMLFVASPVAAVTFKDVPNDHYAKDAVYDLVNRGVTTGYPDGTFRGTEKLNRYDTAVFLNKMARSLEKEMISESRVKEIVRSEVAKAAPANSGSKGWDLSGQYTIRGLLNKIAGSNTRSLASQYRIKLRVTKDLSEDVSIDLGMDNRTYPNDYMPLSDLDIFKAGVFDWGAKAKVDIFNLPLNLEISQGNGDQFHKKTKFQFAGDMGGLILGGAYGYNQGLIANPSNQYSLLAGYVMDLPWLGITSINGSYDMFVGTSEVNPFSGNDTNILQLSVTAVPDDGIKLGAKMGWHGSNTTGMYAAVMLTLDDYWATGTGIYAEFYKLGSAWQSNLGEDYVGVKIFEEFLVTGSENSYLGLKVDQVLNDQWSLLGRLAFNFAGAGIGSLQNTIVEPKLTLQASDIVGMYGAYRYTYDNTTSSAADRLELGAKVNF